MLGYDIECIDCFMDSFLCFISNIDVTGNLVLNLLTFFSLRSTSTRTKFNKSTEHKTYIVASARAVDVTICVAYTE